MSHFRGMVATIMVCALLSPGCTMEVGDGEESGFFDEEGNVDTITEPLIEEYLGNTPVGVLSVNGTCPAGHDKVQFRLDVNDIPSGSFSSWQHGLITPWVSRDAGWIEEGSFLAGGSMTFTFCRVDGHRFKPINSDPYNHTKSYAVLKLGNSCPANSTTSSIYLDTEDNQPSTNKVITGSIAPSAINSYGATLHFCVFYWVPSGAMSTSAWPKYGNGNGSEVPYAVLHDWDVPQGSWVKAKRFYFYDDEDCGSTSKFLNSDAGYVFSPHAEFRNMVQKWNVGSSCGSTDYGYFFEFARVR